MCRTITNSITLENKDGSSTTLCICIGFDSPSIIRFLEPMSGDLFTAIFSNCHFDEIIFPSIGNDKAIVGIVTQKPVDNVSWDE